MTRGRSESAGSELEWTLGRSRSEESLTLATYFEESTKLEMTRGRSESAGSESELFLGRSRGRMLEVTRGQFVSEEFGQCFESGESEEDPEMLIIARFEPDESTTGEIGTPEKVTRSESVEIDSYFKKNAHMKLPEYDKEKKSESEPPDYMIQEQSKSDGIESVVKESAHAGTEEFESGSEKPETLLWKKPLCHIDPYLTELNLSGLGLTSIPDNATLPATLTMIDLSHNKLGMLPQKVFGLTQLQIINLSNNDIIRF